MLCLGAREKDVTEDTEKKLSLQVCCSLSSRPQRLQSGDNHRVVEKLGRTWL